MKKLSIILLSSAVLITSVKAQMAGPYAIFSSAEFESPKGHQVQSPISYGKLGIIQVNPSTKDFNSYSFQLFSQDLKLIKENVVDLEGRIGDKVSYADFPAGSGMVKLKNKTYLFMREVIKNESGKGEGISALEFFPEKLDFATKSKNLFIASDKVKMSMDGFYGFDFSNDKTKFLCYYSLTPKERDDKMSKEIVGLQVFDENLTKVWGDEIEMPYTEAIMDNLGYTLSDDGKVYLLAKVFDSDDRKEGKSKKEPSYRFEVLVYQKGSKTPKIIQIKIDSYFPKEAYIYEDINHTIVVAGFYAKNRSTTEFSYDFFRGSGFSSPNPIDGAYMMRLDVEKGIAAKLNGGYYEIPSDIIKAYASEREKRKLEKKEENDESKDIGVDYLKIQKIYYGLPDGSTKILAEQYHVATRTTYSSNGGQQVHYDTYADDIFVFSIGKDGKLEFVTKIPKSQHSFDQKGAGISFNSIVTGSTVHLFFLDNIKNANLSVNEAPARHENGRGGFLTAITIDNKGAIKKYNMGEIDKFETNFFIRGFVKGDNDNLISTERKKKMNKLFSLEVE
jgi:hypothetical protein